tara:strand:+ start:3652 stop:3843 length:192 start_codon:yes stop_codon:yes gene_type:complete
METQVKRSRGRPPKVKAIEAIIKAPSNEIHERINNRFKDIYGFELTQTQAHAFLLHIIDRIEL